MFLTIPDVCRCRWMISSDGSRSFLFFCTFSPAAMAIADSISGSSVAIERHYIHSLHTGTADEHIMKYDWRLSTGHLQWNHVGYLAAVSTWTD